MSCSGPSESETETRFDMDNPNPVLEETDSIAVYVEYGGEKVLLYSGSRDDAGFEAQDRVQFPEQSINGQSRADHVPPALRKSQSARRIGGVLDQGCAGLPLDFSGGLAKKLELAPGEYVLAVKDVGAFEARYGADLPVIGPYAGSLTNAGERLTLQDAAGQTIHDLLLLGVDF